jgi:hypothetical protein
MESNLPGRELVCPERAYFHMSKPDQQPALLSRSARMCDVRDKVGFGKK